MTSGMAGVTKEDLQRSAERIYFRYLIPQAEKPVRIPGAVRQRVASMMDSSMMTSSSPNLPPSSLPVVDNFNTDPTGMQGQGQAGNNINNGTVISFPESVHSGGGASTTTGGGALKRKNNLGTATFSSTSSSFNKNKNNKPPINEKSPLRSSTVAAAGHNMTTAPSLMQPDQDLGLVFAEAREIVFEGMESFYFPRFLQARAYGNLVHSQRVMRLLIGLFILFLGFVIVLCLIFLNIRPRSVRAWVRLRKKNYYAFLFNGLDSLLTALSSLFLLSL
jgi:hypothetical protein